MRHMEFEITTTEHATQPAYAIISDMGKHGIIIWDTANTLERAKRWFERIKSDRDNVEFYSREIKKLEIVKATWHR